MRADSMDDDDMDAGLAAFNAIHVGAQEVSAPVPTPSPGPLFLEEEVEADDEEDALASLAEVDVGTHNAPQLLELSTLMPSRPPGENPRLATLTQSRLTIASARCRQRRPITPCEPTREPIRVNHRATRMSWGAPHSELLGWAPMPECLAFGDTAPKTPVRFWRDSSKFRIPLGSWLQDRKRQSIPLGFLACVYFVHHRKLPDWCVCDNMPVAHAVRDPSVLLPESEVAPLNKLPESRLWAKPPSSLPQHKHDARRKRHIVAVQAAFEV